MSSFISKSACRGNRPAHLLSYRYYQRQRLVSHLLRERGVARFIVAPYGYGKTGLALEYADTIFGFSGVYWINCKSPCFIRDLDEGCIASDCLRFDPKMKLVVFEDVPPLDAERAEEFSREIDAILSSKREVLVTCAPSCDTLGRLQQDRVTVTAKELLLDDEELSIVHDDSASSFTTTAPRISSCRVPMLVWTQRQGAARDFLTHGFREEAPSDLLLALVCTSVLGAGSFADLVALGPIDRDLIGRTAINYPHLGFNEDLDAFEAPSFDVADIAFALRGVIDAFVRRSSYDSRETFTSALAALLMDNGKLERASEIIRLICPRKSRITWLMAHARQLVAGSCFLPLLQLAGSTRPMGMTIEQRSMLSTVESLCFRMLDSPDEACRCAKRYAFESQTPIEYRVINLLVLAQCSTNTLRERAATELATIAATGSRMTVDAQSGSAYISLAQAWCMASIGTQELYEFWNKSLSEGLSDDMLCIIASWFYNAYADELNGGGSVADMLPPFNCSPIERFVRDCIEASPSLSPNFFAISAGLAMESAHVKGMSYYEGPLSTSALIGLRNAEMALLAQRSHFVAESAQSTLQQDNWLATHPESALSPRRKPPKVQARLSIPTLSIKTFGRLELRIGGEPIDEDSIKSAHVRPLIVLLASNPGREIPRDSICKSMWPDSPLQISRKSFYTVWSKLRQALVLPDGSCPYLIRHRVGCAFNSSYVQSDIARLDEICRTFLFEEPDFTRWSELLAEVDRDFSGDLLPAETTNDLVVQTREECQTKLVDALVVASAGIAQTGNPRRAAWCAQMALDHDDTREDAYLELMRAQAASGQRVAAMATGRRAMHVLSEKLGIDPSSELMVFYQQLLESEDL